MIRLPGGWRLGWELERRRRFGRFYLQLRLNLWRLNAEGQRLNALR